MRINRIRYGIVLAVVLGPTALGVHADLVTPDSILNPPAAVGSANNTPIFSNSSFVTTQYTGLGLNFSTGMFGPTTAITQINGVDVWAPAFLVGHIFTDTQVGAIGYGGQWTGMSFVQPGTLKPAIATSLSVEIMGRQTLGLFATYANNPGVAIPASIAISSEANGGQLYTFPAGPGITSFSVFAPIDDQPHTSPSLAPAALIEPAWGVAQVSFTLASAPEPTSCVLAALGGLGMAVCHGRRRFRRLAWLLGGRNGVK